MSCLTVLLETLGAGIRHKTFIPLPCFKNSLITLHLNIVVWLTLSLSYTLPLLLSIFQWSTTQWKNDPTRLPNVLADQAHCRTSLTTFWKLLCHSFHSVLSMLSCSKCGPPHARPHCGDVCRWWAAGAASLTCVPHYMLYFINRLAYKEIYLYISHIFLMPIWK